jgi:hypothetical protein
MDKISSLADVRPGDFYIGPLGGPWLGRVAVAAGEIIIGDGFQVGELSAQHMGIVVEASDRVFGSTEVLSAKMAQAMPGGANVIDLTDDYWTPRSAFFRIPEDYPGQAADAAAVALAMVAAGVGYSPLSYVYLAEWHWGLKTTRVEAAINRRRSPAWGVTLPSDPDHQVAMAFPVEAICSQFVDDAYTQVQLPGHSLMTGVPRQVVTPGGVAGMAWRRPGVIWGGAGLLEST